MMMRTFTLTEAQHHDVTRALLAWLDELLDLARTELEQLLADSDRDLFGLRAGDAYAHLTDVPRALAALQALGWPGGER